MSELIGALRGGSSFERSGAAAELGALGPRAAPATDALTEAVLSGDPFVTREAALALGSIGAPARPAIPALISAMKARPASDTAEFAAEAIGKLATRVGTGRQLQH